MRVAVVGAGASGLVSLCSLLNSGWPDEVVAFESYENVGGSWVYREEGPTTAMYENLRTNLPKDCMGFFDQDFAEHLPTFMTHYEVRAYLNEYTRRNELEKFIRFQSKVISIEPVDLSNPHTGSWDITWQRKTDVPVTERFDYVIIGNGHYSTPFLPDVPGISNFKGITMHSNEYRNNKNFKGKRVVIQGNGASAADIGMEIAPVATEVFQCKRLDSVAPFKFKAKGITSRGNIQSVDEESGDIVLEDGSVISNVDVLIFCTGFHYDFPFLNSERSRIQIEYKRVSGLLFHIFPFSSCHPQYDSNEETCIAPTIAFVGLPWKVLPFPLFDVQARFITAIWSGAATLPSIKEVKQIMDKEAEFRENANLPPHYLHCLGVSQFVYCKKLLELAGLENLCPIIDKNKEIAKQTKWVRLDHPNYKDFTLKLLENGKWKYFPPDC